ncbi:lytic transglycosylase domain-containing protein [Citrobacter freundii]|uniref:lytic transglycosylase domain-containing protein n=1 Tax=Citrobacter freundii TaxID=546 RepID=UPI001749F974|nr:lytic transglycosylase domain-containing protein [Citrobacter freundii]MBD5686243.1 lytic transglycosylase domain-containing protein [Citrobacter freundii]
MIGNADTIKDFLVSLGFDIDQAGANKFEAVLKGVTANVLKVGAVVEGAALSIVGFTTQIANGLDKIYWASQRTGASVQGIKALGYAASQTGASAESAMSSLEGLAGFMRSNPGAEGFLNRLGVQTRDASGKMRDTAAIFTGVGQKLNNMPYYRAKQYAQMLGIDENTLMAMRRGMGQLSSEYALTAKRIGFNAESAAKQSNIFMTSMRNLTMTLGQAKDKIGSNLAGGLAGSIDNLRRQILDNWPKIEAVITKIIKGILWAGDAITRVLWRTGQAVEGVIAWFKKLNPATQQLIALFSGLLVAWRLLNTAFMSSPLGMITTLIIALGLLLDDYQTWKEGGKSLIDWGKWKTEIDQAVKMIGDLKKTVTDLTKALAKLLGIDPKSWSLKWDFSNFISQMGEFGKMLNMIADLLNAIKDGNWAQAASIGKQLLNQGSGQPSATPAVEDSANRSADWVKENLGFDPRSVGRTIRGWFGDDEPDQHAQSAKAPRGIRNNNPGNIDFRGQSGATLERPGGRFARFETAYDGLKALSRQLMRYFEGKTTGKPLQTLNDIISTWAPGNENNTGAYIAQLSKMMGVAPDAILNLKDPQVMSSLMNGIIHHENGRNPYPSELVRMAAGGGTSQNIQQETVINIHGVSDPREAANITVERQKNVNSQLTQQLRTVPS